MTHLLLPLPAEPSAPEEACLVMTDLVGSTRIAHRLSLGAYAALMAEFVQVLMLSFEVHGGQVLQHQGDAVLALWPAEAAQQALRAAVGAHDRAAGLGLAGALGLQLRVRSGVAAGEVVTGMVGGQPSAYGLPVNYARRLCDAANPGETLVCGAAARALGPGVPLLPRTLPPLRGFGPHSQAYRVLVPAAPAATPMKTG
ncbi:adenylate/guanylate cyclase domain-containing protein [Deinococcus sp. SDU3-2]|uniref:Adenylate/guanylate cyclase domain-containing protein n=1 Tax=Deinococcus terrestris TaxID=2651870 RepID=A0A7X1NVP8_9DEIO|nr:adenylate/guanylate cyclase domain-containing protein [Deinococcus terrestris]MPY66682.1 adenylate/guanylate cyclase domain-containing protein [Deinococcus terrestris]